MKRRWLLVVVLLLLVAIDVAARVGRAGREQFEADRPLVQFHGPAVPPERPVPQQ